MSRLALYLIVFLLGCVLSLSIWLDFDEEAMATLRADWGLLGQPVALVTTLPVLTARERGKGCVGNLGVTSMAPIPTLGRLKCEPGAFLRKASTPRWPGFFSKPESEAWT